MSTTFFSLLAAALIGVAVGLSGGPIWLALVLAAVSTYVIGKWAESIR